MAARTMERLVGELVTALEERTSGDPASEVAIRRRLGTLVTGCGWKKRTATRMEALRDLLHEENVFPIEDIADISLPLSHTVYLRRVPPPGPVLEFLSEKDLERFIARNHRVLFQGMSDLAGSQLLAGGSKPQKQYRYGRSIVKPDLVFRTPTRTYVVVEVKLGDPGDSAVTQLRKYMAAASKEHKYVRGLLISGSPRSRAQVAAVRAELEAAAPGHAHWLQYEAGLKLSPPDEDE